MESLSELGFEAKPRSTVLECLERKCKSSSLTGLT